MTTCAKGRKKTEALEVFKSRQEIRPDFDVISYKSLIIAYANRGKIEQGLEVLNSMQAVGVHLGRYHYL